MIISPFTPLRFCRERSDGIASRYTQTFSPSDHILLQLIGSPDEDSPECYIENGDRMDAIELRSWQMSDEYKIWFCVIHGLNNGDDYHVLIPAYGLRSNTFRVTDNADELCLTTLVQYSMRDNRERTDGVFLIDNMRHFFDFRVPGGFKDAGWSFGVDNAQFMTQEGDIVELYARETTHKQLTMGNQQGCPIWFGEMLNRALCCSYVYLDGERYARKDSSVPEPSRVLEGLDSFTFNIQLQKVTNLNPTIETQNHIAMRRTDEQYRISNNNNRIL